MSTEKIALLRVDGDGLAAIVRSVTTEQADQIATELMDAHGSGEELMLVRARRGKLSLVDVVVPAEVAARTVADLDAVTGGA